MIILVIKIILRFALRLKIHYITVNFKLTTHFKLSHCVYVMAGNTLLRLDNIWPSECNHKQLFTSTSGILF